MLRGTGKGWLHPVLEVLESLVCKMDRGSCDPTARRGLSLDLRGLLVWNLGEKFHPAIIHECQGPQEVLGW